MKKLWSAFAGALFLFTACVASPAKTPLVITFDPGGNLIEYIAKYAIVRQSGGSVVIDGACISACTLMTGILEDDQVCVTERASLAFHSASDGMGRYSEEGTQLLWHVYPPAVRKLLQERGWNGDTEHPALIYIEGEALRSIYRPCGSQGVYAIV